MDVRYNRISNKQKQVKYTNNSIRYRRNSSSDLIQIENERKHKNVYCKN